MSEIQARITAILRKHAEALNARCSGCGESIRHVSTHQADALVRELGLTPRYARQGTEREAVSDEPECECWPVENPWTYYGIVEPGGAMEWNPDCPAHPPGVR